MFTISRKTSNNEDFRSLITLLDHDLWGRYDSVQKDYIQHNQIEYIETVIVVYDKDKPVGCGCFKIYDVDTVEIKRMFVISDYRGKGISKLILKNLEEWAFELGYKKAVLETRKQPEAIGLYKKLGYQQVENYGPYKNMPNSICFSKILEMSK